MIYRRADAIQAISHYLAQRARAMGHCGRIEVIGNGVPESFFQNTDREVDSTKKTIVSVSRLVEKNGIEYLVRAMAHIDARLVLVGDGPLRSELEGLATELGVSEKITFIGSVSYEQVPEYLAKADVFVRPSLSEGLGSAFLEAMAMRVPVVATPVGGIVDFMIEGETGWLVNPRDVSQLVEKIQYVLDSDNQETVNTVIERAHKLVASEYRWDEVAQKMNTLFEQTLNTQKKLLLATGIYPPDIGGPATYSKLLYEKLPAQGIAVWVLSFGSVRRYPKAIRHVLYMWKLLWLSRGVDCIYAQDTISVGLPAAIVSKITRKKLLLKIVGDYAWEQGVQRFGVTDRLDVFVTKYVQYVWQVRVLKIIEKHKGKQLISIV
jgi:glycosyltransferase involved in cell wall biosynthesis